MHYAFQDYDNLYLVLDLLTGGDLRYQISRHPRQYFSEIETKFFISCLIESLLYIHSKKVIHRDIKPENLVFDENGYLHITDFGIAKFFQKNNNHETSGTPGYMAPEVMQGKNHTSSVDFYAVGVIIYELMMGKRPYTGKNRKEIKEQIMSRQAKIIKMEIPEGWSFEAADFANKLLIRKDLNRLGYNNEQIIKEHPWLKDVEWDKIRNKEIKASFVPKKNHDNYDKNYCEEVEEINLETFNRFEEYKLNKNYKDMFFGFTFYNVNVNDIIYNKFKSSNIILKRKKIISEINNMHKNEEINEIKKDINNEDFENDKINKSVKNIFHSYNKSFFEEKNLKLNYSLSKIISRKNINKNNIKKDLQHYSPINNYKFGYNEAKRREKLLSNDIDKETKLKKSKSFSLNFFQNDKSNNSYLTLIKQLNLESNKNQINENDNDNDNNIEIKNPIKSYNNLNDNINNEMMKLSTNFYLKHSLKEEKINEIKKRERPKSIPHLNRNILIDKNKIKNNKIKKLNTNKNFYKRKLSLNKKTIKNNDKNNNNNNIIKYLEKKLNKNYSQGNIKKKINKNKKIDNDKNLSNNKHQSKSLNKSNSHINNNVNKSYNTYKNSNNNKHINKTINRNSSTKRKSINYSQKFIPLPVTSGKKFNRKKLDSKTGIKINLNENNKNSIYFNKNLGTPILDEKGLFYINKTNINKNLLNDLSFNNNENNNSNFKIKSNYNTINVDEKINYLKGSHNTLNTDLIYTLKKINSFKALKPKIKYDNNFTKLKKNKIKINVEDNNCKNKNVKNSIFNNTNYKFKSHKKINTNINDNNNKSINLKYSSFEINNNNLGPLSNKNNRGTSVNKHISNSNICSINNNRNINQKNIKENSKNIKIKIKNIIGNHSNYSIYSTASTGQNKIYNK